MNTNTEGDILRATLPQTANVYEHRLRDVLSIVQDYLLPTGISATAAMERITGIVDPWPMPPAAPACSPTAAADAGVPEGYALVPVKPTEAMLCAGGRTLTAGPPGDRFTAQASQVYRAMLDASRASSSGQAQPSAPAKFPYHPTFEAIAAATRIQGRALSISVEAFNETYSRLAAPAESSQPSAPDAPACSPEGLTDERIVALYIRVVAESHDFKGPLEAFTHLVRMVERELLPSSRADGGKEQSK